MAEFDLNFKKRLKKRACCGLYPILADPPIWTKCEYCGIPVCYRAECAEIVFHQCPKCFNENGGADQPQVVQEVSIFSWMN